jgi:acetyl-CoA synthetase
MADTDFWIVVGEQSMIDSDPRGAPASDRLTERVRELLDLYGNTPVSLANVLCDGRDPSAVAYRIVAADLTCRDLTYGALRQDSERLAAALASMGVRRGDRVATLMSKSREYLVTLLSLWRIGAVHVPLFTAFASPAIQFRLQASGARHIVVDAAQLPKLAEIESIPLQVITTGTPTDTSSNLHELLTQFEPGFPAASLDPADPFIQIYTSGTTGAPKGVPVPIRALAAFRAYAEFGLDLRPDDVHWCAADPGWAYGLYYGVLASLLTGTISVLFEGSFSPETTFAVLARLGVTNFAAAPTVYRSLRASNIQPERIELRCATSAGEPLTPEVNEWAHAALGVQVHDHYGQTETGMLINNHHHPLLKRSIKPRSMGTPLPGWSAAVLMEESEELAPPNVVGRVAIDLRESPLAWFEGYDKDSAKSAEKFSADGRWYVTGDTGFFDEEGHFCFSSRDDDVIIMAGYRIGPSDVESVLATHPAVVESAVIAAPDEIRGEVIEAFVVLRPSHPASAELVGDIQKWVKTRFAAHAYPRKVHFVESLPKTPSGKIQRFVLRQQRRAALEGGGASR